MLSITFLQNTKIFSSLLYRSCFVCMVVSSNLKTKPMLSILKKKKKNQKRFRHTTIKKHVRYLFFLWLWTPILVSHTPLRRNLHFASKTKEFINSKSLSSVERLYGVIITHFSCTRFCTYLHLYLMKRNLN